MYYIEWLGVTQTEFWRQIKNDSKRIVMSSNIFKESKDSRALKCWGVKPQVDSAFQFLPQHPGLVFVWPLAILLLLGEPILYSEFQNKRLKHCNGMCRKLR